MNINNAATPNIDDAPTSCHKKYPMTNVCKGPINKNSMLNIAVSNRFTSFDNKFTI